MFPKTMQKHASLAVLISEISHIFCCVIPTLVTILSAFANLGLFVIAPDGILMSIHHALHEYEAPVILFSGVMVAIGWIAYFVSRRMDCHDTGCVHLPCAQKKTKNSKILIVASLLFLLNIVVYFGVHRNIFGVEIFHQKTVVDPHNESDYQE